MDYLLDTHTVIWFVTKNNLLPDITYRFIETTSSKCFVSVASLWEIAIKYSAGKLELNKNLEQIFEIIDESGIELLPVTPKHILKVAQLPFHHRDPFDRVIIAQAIVEKLNVITKDELFSSYPIATTWG